MTSQKSRPDDLAVQLKKEQELRRCVEGERDALSNALSESQSLVVDLQMQLRGRTSERAQRLASITRQTGRWAPQASRRGQALRLAAKTVDTLMREGPRGLRTAYIKRRDWRQQAARLGDGSAYRHWLATHEPSPAELARQRTESKLWPERPLISILMPVYNSKDKWLTDAVASVMAQTYSNWELCVVDDHSDSPQVADHLERLGRHPKIRVVKRAVNGGIAAASQTALGLAKGEYVAFLDHDDILRPQALYALMCCVRDHPRADVVYSDEDKLLLDGSRGWPTFKPEWSPALLLSTNYICHLTMIRRQLVETVGGFRAGYDGSQDHDLFLRATEAAREIQHVAQVLYTWRQVPGSAALAAGEKPYAHIAGKAAVASALQRRAIRGSVEDGPGAGMYYVRYQIPGLPTVDIVIPTRDRVDLLRACVASIEQLSTYPAYRLVIVDNDSSKPETAEYLKSLSDRHLVITVPGPFNYSKLMNRAIDKTDGEYILMLNNDTTVVTPDWIEAMLREASQEGIGAVGCRLRYPHGGVQHEGIRLGGGRLASNLPTDPTWPTVRERSAVTGACLMVRRSILAEIGGFDEELAVAWNDVDLCLRIWKAGYRVICTPYAELIHHEAASRASLSPEADSRHFVGRWGPEDGLVDRYVSIHASELEAGARA